MINKHNPEFRINQNEVSFPKISVLIWCLYNGTYGKYGHNGKFVAYWVDCTDDMEASDNIEGHAEKLRISIL